MPRPISLDLRQRAVQAYLDGEGTQADIAQRFSISSSALARWLAMHRAGAPLEALPHSGGASHTKLFDEHRDALFDWLTECGELTGPELASLLLERFELKIDPSQITRRLNEWGWSRKKNRWVLTDKTGSK